MISTFPLYGQSGGQSYEFLNLPVSARTTALGGKTATSDDVEPGMSYLNPSLLKREDSNTLSLNYTGYLAGIKYGFVSYSKSLDSLYTLSAGIQYIDYGSFIEADETGLILGNYSAADYMMNLSCSRPLGKHFNLGMSIKPVYSDYKFAKSTGIAADIGIQYFNKENLFTASVLLRNAGMQITSYSGEREPFPFELIAGFSQKLKYAPFRFVVTFQQLQTFQQNYDLPDFNTASSKASINKNMTNWEHFADNALRHVIAGVEFVPAKNFFATFSLNFKRRYELRLVEKSGLSGYSFGAGVTIKKFRITVARSVFHLAGHYQVISISTRFNDPSI